MSSLAPVTLLYLARLPMTARWLFTRCCLLLERHPPKRLTLTPSARLLPPLRLLPLKTPPKWFRRPVGATFGFGGQLAYFGATEGPRNVTLASISVETQVLQRSDDLENALTTDAVEEYCEKQASSASAENDKITWDVLRLLFKEDSRNQLVQMLGVERNVSKNETEAVLESLGIKPTATEEPAPEEPQESQTEPVEETKDGEVNTFFQEDGQEKDDDFFSQTHKQSEAAPESIVSITTKPFKINGDTSSMEGLLSKMVVIGDFSGAVDLCLQTTRYADALILAMCGGGDLLTKTKKEVFRLRRDEASYVRLLENVIEGNFLDVVQNADLAEWQKIVAMICTYAQGEEFSRLMETLGSRLHKSAEPSASQNALMCFLLAGNMARVVEIWVGDGQTPRSMDSLHLQSLIEKVAIFSKAIDFTEQDDSLALLYMVYYQYASLLASQGYMHTAAKYLSLIPSSHQGPTLFSLDDFSALKYRLYYAGVEVDSIDPSVYPYAPAEIGAPAYEAPQQAFQPAQQQTYQQPQPTYQQAQPPYQPAQPTYPSTQAPFQPAQQPFYGGSYQQPAPYVPEPTQATASPYDMTALYNPYPNYPPTNLPAATTQQEVVPPPSAQKGGPAWNDPPSEVFATKQAPARAQAKAPIMSPFSNSTSANAPPTQQPYQPFNASTLPPPPQDGRAPTPLYRSSPAPARPTPQQGVRQMAAPPALQQGMPQQPSMQQHGMPQQPPMHQQGMPQQPMQRPPPRPSVPAQRPLYQTSPAPPTQAPRANLPGPGTPHPNMGMSQPPRPQQSVISPTPTPPKSQPAPMDRSKMPPKYKQVFEQLSKSLAAVKSAGFPPAQQRMVIDVDRRMTMLFDAMNSDQLHAPLAGLLAEYGQALEAKDYSKALNLQSDMVNRHVDQVGTWVLGLKHIVTLLRSMN
ncbi:protein transport protein S31 [Entomophthora muscae]|uniref:Protein transport protein S31 n=1 Tax=Entomophthora muscae TaxID=34485 RepID=A0ACC2TZM9_9FUNG|nr:protein transport protein S31 [Entomophthora muscae]